MKIAYLGPAGTYSEEAARLYGGSDASYIPANSVEEATNLIEVGQADAVVVAVENSTEGAVNPTLDLLVDTPLQICGEVMLPIHHQLLSKSQSLDAITEVMAHPQALAQCRQWLEEHLSGVSQVAAVSNAQAAAEAARRPSLAAIAGQRAAGLYGLTALGTDIEDIAGNTTRFLALSKQAAPLTGYDKTSLVCSAPNRPGGLYALLGILTKYQLNMTKLESRPVPNATWDYIFFIDIEGHREDEHIAAALSEVEATTTFLKIIGSYPRA